MFNIVKYDYGLIMQILNFPDAPVRTLEWYKTRYEGLREDVVVQTHRYEELANENKSLRIYIDTIQEQLRSSKENIDVLWNALDKLNPNGLSRIEHDE